MSTLGIPKPTLAGNTKQSLIDELMEIRSRLDYALRAMRDIEFTNGRNFVAVTALDGGTLYRKAVEEHAERIKAVEDVSREILTIAFEIQEGK